jgi:hypothetical protein
MIKFMGENFMPRSGAFVMIVIFLPVLGT